MTEIPGLTVTTGAWTPAVKLSDTASPLLSVAVTVMPMVCAVAGAVPLKVSVAALKLNQFGSAQFSAFKSALVDLSVAKLGPIATEMQRLLRDPVMIDAILADGSARARKIAGETMKAVKDIVGFVRS